jgi:hypothetical protein
MTRFSIGPRLGLFTLVLIGLGQPGFAADPGYCHRYASNAAQAQLRNIQYRCAFVGRAWSTDYGDHFGWCIQAPWEAADREERVRRRLLRSCLGW